MLSAWAASPARFREDANAEELLSIGYRGRVIAELAANAADAARSAGVDGEIAIDVIGDGNRRELRVCNTGAPLDAPGVAALASLRASAKRDADTVGHFGVGFTAVRAVTDEPLIVSMTGAVRFSVADTCRAVEDLAVPALVGELRRRGDQVPALRLPWPVAASPAPPLAPFATCVRLPLRPDVDAEALAASLTADLAADLLWALPDLTVVTVPGVRVERSAAPETGIERITVIAGADSSARDYRVLRRSGVIPAELLAGRPMEERRRSRWRLAWIVPLDPDGHPAAVTAPVVGAPTPTAEPVDLPAKLVITVPVDESRGRVAAGPLTDFLIDMAADAYAEMLRAAPEADRPALLPPVSFPLGDFDATLRAALTARLERSEFLCGAGGVTIRPADAVLVPPVAGAAARCAAEALPGLIPWPVRPETAQRLRRLGVRVLPVSELTGALAALDRPVSFWHTVYDGLAEVPVDELADLPVPRAGGGTIVGPRGVLLPDEPAGSDDPDTAPWAPRAAAIVPGLRLAATGADHPLLRRLGAIAADAASVLADPSLAREIGRRLDDLDAGLGDDPDPEKAAEFARLVLDLLRAAGSSGSAAPGRAGLSDVLLTDVDGEIWPAGSLLLPGAPLAAVLAPDADLPVVGPQWIADYGSDLLECLGVRSGFGLTRFAVPPGSDVDLPDVDAWWAEQAGGNEPSADAGGERQVAITDLDLVDGSAWPAALAMIAERRGTRDALRPGAFGPSYSAWWLARHAVVDGAPPRRWRVPGSAELAGLYDEFPVPLAAEVCVEIGVLRTVSDAAADPAELLRRWADPARTVPPWRVATLTAALVVALGEAPEGPPGDLPAAVRVLTGAVIDADAAAVADAPALSQVLDPATVVAGGPDPRRTADVLDLPLASERYRFEVVAGEGRQSDGPHGGPPDAGPVALCELPGAARCLDLAGRADLAARPVWVAPDLAVRPVRAGGRPVVRVRWWADGDQVLVDGSAAGIGRAVAFLAGRWADRHRLTAAAAGAAVDLAETGLD